MKYILENNINYSLGKYRSLTKDIINRINNFKGKVVEGQNLIEVIIISGDNVDNISQIVDNLGGKYENTF